MLKEIKKNLIILEYLNKLSPKERQNYLKSSKNIFLKRFIDLLFNINCGNLYTSDFFLNKLRLYKIQIQNLCKKGKSLKSKKDLLIKNKLFSKLIPILTELLIKNEIFD